MLMTMYMCGAMSIVMFSLYRSFRHEVDGIGQWSLGLFLLLLAAALFSLREHFSQSAIVLLTNSAMLCGIGLSMIGTEKFFGRPPSWLLYKLCLVVGLAGIAWWQLADADFGARVALFSFIVFVFYARQVLLVARHGEHHFSSLFFGVLMLFQAAVVLARGVAALRHGGDTVNLLKDGVLINIYLAAGNFMALLLTVGFMTIAMRRLQTILEKRSTLDPLTQVLNRRGFDDAYQREKALLRRKQRPMTLMSLDLDFFKAINDRHGHATGDRVLAHVARLVGSALRETDHLARFGGEEFVVLLPDTHAERAAIVARRIRELLCQPCDEELPPCTISIGIACQSRSDESLDSLLLRADAALYRAKENGRDRAEFDLAA